MPDPGIVNPPPQVMLFNYPGALTVVSSVVATSILLFISGRFDKTQGVLTISIMIVLGMLGAVAYCLIFTVPADDITPGVVGGLTAGFGAVIAHWLGRPHASSTAPTPPEPPPQKPPPPPGRGDEP